MSLKRKQTLREYQENLFLNGRNQQLQLLKSTFKDLQMQSKEVVLESDSHLVINAILNSSSNLLEVGEVLDSYRSMLAELHAVSVVFIWKNANKVAHQIARIPCEVNSRNLFTSHPTCLLEALSFDLLF